MIRWFNKLLCKWFGHKPQISTFTVSHYEKREGGQWTRPTRQQRIKNCKRCKELLENVSIEVGLGVYCSMPQVENVESKDK